MSSTRSVGLLTIVNAAGGLAALATSVVTNIYFGTTRGVELYFAATGLQTSILALTQTGQFAELFLPVYHRIKQADGVVEAQRAFATMTNWLLVTSGTIGLLLWLMAPWAMQLRIPGFPRTDIAVGVAMFRAVAPLLLIQVFESLAFTLANAEGRFGLPETIGVGGRCLGLVAIPLLAPIAGPWALVGAFWISQIGVCLGLVAFLSRLGYRHSFQLSHPAVKPGILAKQLVWTLSNTATAQVWTFAFDAALSLLPRGTFAVVRYVQTLFERSRGIALRPVAVVFFTRFSEAVAAGMSGLRDHVRRSLSLSLLSSAVLLAPVLGAGSLTLKVLWPRMSTTELELGSVVLAVFFGTLPLAGLWQVYRKVSIAVGFGGATYAGICVAQLVAAGALWPLTLAFGVNGVLWAYAIYMVALCAAPAGLLAWRKRDALVFFSGSEVACWALGVTCGAILLRGLQAVLGPSRGVIGMPAALQWAWCGGLWVVGVGVTVAIAGLAGVPDARRLWAQLNRARRSSGGEMRGDGPVSSDIV